MPTTPKMTSLVSKSFLCRLASIVMLVGKLLAVRSWLHRVQSMLQEFFYVLPLSCTAPG